MEWKFGRIVETHVEGRSSKVQIEYRNHNETVFRTVVRHLSHVTLNRNMEEVDYNSRDHQTFHRESREINLLGPDFYQEQNLKS